MKIPFVTRSGFLSDCSAGIAAQRDDLLSGLTVTIHLKKGGYSREFDISLSADDQIAFDANYQSNDPTWFPVRIRAAATALRDATLYGQFHIAHKDGEVHIRWRSG